MRSSRPSPRDAHGPKARETCHRSRQGTTSSPAAGAYPPVRLTPPEGRRANGALPRPRLVLWGCTDPSQSQLHRSEPGVAIARNDLERLDALPVYGVETSVDLGNPERLYGVVGAVMLGDEIAVANAGNHEVLTFGGGMANCSGRWAGKATARASSATCRGSA